MERRTALESWPESSWLRKPRLGSPELTRSLPCQVTGLRAIATQRKRAHSMHRDAATNLRSSRQMFWTGSSFRGRTRAAISSPRGISLNALVGRQFQVGSVSCVGRRLAEPCSHLERLARPGLLRPLVHRGGLRADVAHLRHDHGRRQHRRHRSSARRRRVSLVIRAGELRIEIPCPVRTFSRPTVADGRLPTMGVTGCELSTAHSRVVGNDTGKSWKIRGCRYTDRSSRELGGSGTFSRRRRKG